MTRVFHVFRTDNGVYPFGEWSEVIHNTTEEEEVYKFYPLSPTMNGKGGGGGGHGTGIAIRKWETKCSSWGDNPTTGISQMSIRPETFTLWVARRSLNWSWTGARV